VVLEVIADNLQRVFPSLQVIYHRSRLGRSPSIVIQHTQSRIKRRLLITHRHGHDQLLVVEDKQHAIVLIDLNHPESLERLETVVRQALLEANSTNICAAGLCPQLPVCSPVPDVEVEHCVRWLDTYGLLALTKSPCSSSYRWKHCVEEWCGSYVSNGAFMMACRLRGVAMRDLDGTNMDVAISESKVSKLMDADWQVFEDGIYSASNMELLRIKLQEGLQRPSDEHVQVCLRFLDANAARFLTKTPRLSLFYLCESMRRRGMLVSFGALIAACQIRSMQLLRRKKQEYMADVLVNLNHRIFYERWQSEAKN
jgi:hypothetical protein